MMLTATYMDDQGREQHWNLETCIHITIADDHAEVMWPGPIMVRFTGEVFSGIKMALYETDVRNHLNQG
jgi:hypothetical protein